MSTTQTMSQVSAVIITFNEEAMIQECIQSVQGIADEILVVDSYSTDRTKQICEAEGVRFLENAFEGHIEQKNYAMRQASHDMILSLDADERLDDALRDAIMKEKKNGFKQAYSFNRLNNYCGKWIRHGGWYPDRKIRLWDRSIGNWGGVNPHDKVILQSHIPVHHLPGDLLHYSVVSVEEHERQIVFFSSTAAKAAYQSGKRTNLIHMWVSPYFKFLRDYVFRTGFLDGYYGWVIARNSAYAKWAKYLKLYEYQKNKL